MADQSIRSRTPLCVPGIGFSQSVCIVAVAAGMLLLPSAPEAQTVSFLSLLQQLPNLDALAEYPGSSVTTGEPNSTCPASFSADWYCNYDYNQFVRTETNQGRTEQVMADVTGPGALTRLWIGGPYHGSANIRFYFDGSSTPSITENLDQFMQGGSWAKAPFVWQAGPPLQGVGGQANAPAGLNLMLPIPFAYEVKVTYDGPQSNAGNDPLYYNFEYRRFPGGTSVQTFSQTDYTNNAGAVQNVAGQLSAIVAPTSTSDAYGAAAQSTLISQSIAPGGSVTVNLPGGSNAVRLLTLRTSDTSTAGLRNLHLGMTFDGEQTISAPVGDFFGSGYGFNPGTTQTQSVGSGNSMSSRWTMPYRSSATLTLRNNSGSTITVLLGGTVGYYPWDGNSMHFHAVFRDTGSFALGANPTGPSGRQDEQDMRFLNVFGTGVLVGDNETVSQSDDQSTYSWWGEGDEKIYVDGDVFPSHFGTGTEDYYDYSYGHVNLFQSPWASQALAPPSDYTYVGTTVLNRTRLLDAIPFGQHLRYDFEFSSWNPSATEDFAHVAFFYALPGAEVDQPGIVSGATYLVQSKVSGWNLDVTYGSNQPGALVQDYLPDGSGAQQWVVTSAGGGYYTFRNVLSGLYLDLPNQSNQDAVQLQQYTYNGSCAQLWQLTPTTNNHYTITNQCSGKLVDVYYASTAPGTHVNQYHADGTAAQEWRFDRISP